MSMSLYIISFFFGRSRTTFDSFLSIFVRPTSRAMQGNNLNNNGGLQVGLADDQAKDFDFEKTEMKYDSTGMFHWSPAKNLEDCILVSNDEICLVL